MDGSGCQKADLLYLTDEGADDVYVYSWPRGELKGTLTGFDAPNGECVDKAGDVFVANEDESQILEYAHGGTSPIETLSDPAISRRLLRRPDDREPRRHQHRHSEGRPGQRRDLHRCAWQSDDLHGSVLLLLLFLWLR